MGRGQRVTLTEDGSPVTSSQALDDILQHLREELTLKNNPSVSDAGKCQRKVVMSLMNIEESNPADFDSQLRFAVGHAFEEAIARILEAYQGATYVREDRVEIVSEGVKITGRKDFDAVRVATDDAIIELKSTNARSMGFLLKRGTPNDEHVRQLNLYLHSAGKQIGYLVYLAAGSTKGEPPLHSWIVRYDKAMAEADIAAAVAADRMAKAGVVPAIPQDYKKSGYPCSYCNFKDLCHGDPSIALKASIDLKNGAQA